jgi:hypothetical protein
VGIRIACAPGWQGTKPAGRRSAKASQVCAATPTRKTLMDMNAQMPPAQPEEGAEDPKALLEQAKGLIDKALAAMNGGEEQMSVEQAFGQGFEDPRAAAKY